MSSRLPVYTLVSSAVHGNIVLVYTVKRGSWEYLFLGEKQQNRLDDRVPLEIETPLWSFERGPAGKREIYPFCTIGFDVECSVFFCYYRVSHGRNSLEVTPASTFLRAFLFWRKSIPVDWSPKLIACGVLIGECLRSGEWQDHK